MKTSSISNLAISNAMRLTLRTAQNDMVNSATESSTGKHADMGAALGTKTSASITLNQSVMRIDALKATNSIVTQRLSSTQGVLTQMSTAAQSVLNDLTSLSGNEDAKTLDVLTTSIKTQLQTFTSAANTSVAGEYLLSGINTDVQPLVDYTAVPNAAKTAYDNALSSFMSSQTPPLTSIDQFSGAQMQDFITNKIEPMFTGTDWNSTWSSATDENIKSRISSTEVVETSTNANSDGVRYFALASVVATELLGKNLNADARKVVNTQALAYTGQAISSIDDQRTKLGMSEERVTKADDTLDAQKNIIETHLSDLEGIDVYDAATRVKNLQALIDASYTLTAKLQSLSLVNFL